MLYLNDSMKDIQTWLGHSNYNFTADTYVLSVPTAHIQMASTFADNIPMLQGVESGLVDPIVFDSVESAPVFSSIQNISC